MFAHQLSDPLTGRDAAGSGVDFPPPRHDARHDTPPVEPGSAAAELLQPVFGPDRARIRVGVAPAGSRGRPKSPVSPARPAPRPTEASVSSLKSAVFRSAERCSSPQTPRNKRNRQRDPDAYPSFFVGSSSGPVRSHKTGCARLENPAAAGAPLAESGPRRMPYALPFAIPSEANTGALRTSFFSGSAENRTPAGNRLETGR